MNKETNEQCIPLPENYTYPPPVTEDSSIDLEPAKQLINSWVEYFRPMCQNDVIPRGFLIPISGINAIANLQPPSDRTISHVRVYLGLAPVHDLTDPKELINMKLLVVPVDDLGNDYLKDENDKSLIFDFTYPCPPFGRDEAHADAETSPLYVEPYPKFCQSGPAKK